MQPAVQLFINPLSGSYSSRLIARLRRAFHDAGVRTILSESSAAVPASIDRSATHVCVVGGDGTVRHVVAAMAIDHATMPIAQYPAGTINLLARELGYPVEPGAFARRVMEGDGRDHFTASVDDQLFLCCASVGPECRAIANLSPRLKRIFGRFAYGLSFVQTLWRWRRPRLMLTVDDQSFACEAVYIAKGRYFAGPFSFAPRAALTDRYLHVVALLTARRRDYLLFTLDLLFKRDPGLRNGVTSLTCTALAITAKTEEPVQADGDIIAALPIEVTASSMPTTFL